ncbi:MAG: hydantoinase B/oxoprolinase family protein [Candidatus Binatia bacterium]|nr:hydantoinase B/oxoprolinase family protein [Candidatus Binatia bacterium]
MRSIDAIQMEVIYRATLQIAKELALNMLRTGYSSVIKESQDFTFSIFDAQGRMVAQGLPQPLHIGGISAQVNEVTRVHGEGMAPGDVFIVNHPYHACQNHATDVTIVSPVFFDGERIAFIANTAHKPDFGGKVPGTNAPDATDVIQEGLLLPPLRLYRAGQVNEDVRAIIVANTRTPKVTWGDIQAQAQTNFYGLKKLGELMKAYGKEAVLACWLQWMDICEEELRKEIRKIPEGEFGPCEDFLDDDGFDPDRPYRIAASLAVRGGEMFFRLESSEQARGPINLRPCVTKNFIECIVKSVLCPDLPVNQGLSRPIHVSFPPEGSVLNPRYPAPVNMYVRPSQIVTSVVQMVLALALPERVPAPDSSAGGSASFSGQDEKRDRWFSLYDLYCGGAGARPQMDGPSALNSLVVNVMNTPAEAVETEFPIRIRRYELFEESGGAGRLRGGLGMRRDWEILGAEAFVNLRSDRFKYSAPGLNGALPAKPSSAFLNPGTERERLLPSKVTRLGLKKGDIFRIQYAGGGGRGDPLERDVEKVLDDVWNGYIGVETAGSVYGVVIHGWPPVVDEDATRRLRDKGAEA